VFQLAGTKRGFPPSFLGKATTVAHLVTILWVLGCNHRGQDHPLTPVFLGSTVALVLVSGGHYLYLGQQVVAQAGKETLS
jgi:phosphatidylglycerophosphate synthase